MRATSIALGSLLSLTLCLAACGDDEPGSGGGATGGGNAGADTGTGATGNGGSGNSGTGGFGPDTCSGGVNMTDPTLSMPFDPEGQPTDLVFEWQEGTDNGALLPPEYFEQVAIDPFTDQEVVAALVQELGAIDDRQIRVRFGDLTDYRALNDGLTLVLLFPDRRDFIECTHPGMEDRYLLTIDVDWSVDPATVELTETVEYGAI